MMARRRILVPALACGLTAVLLPIIASQVDADTVDRTLDRLSPTWAVAGILAGLLYQALRAFRFALLIRRRWTSGLVATICLQGTARKLLPAWLGEGAVVWLFHNRHGVHPGAGGASLLVARGMDLGIVGLALVALLASGAAPQALPTGLGAAVLVLCALVLLALVGLTVLDARLVRGHDTGTRRMLRRLLSEAAMAARHARPARVFYPVASCTVLMWGAMYLQHYAFLNALGFSLDPAEVLWMQVLVVPVQLLPVRGFADLGTHEAAWFAAATIVGLTSSAAAVVAIGTHILAFAAAGGYLLFALALMAIEARSGDQRRREEVTRSS